MLGQFIVRKPIKDISNAIQAKKIPVVFNFLIVRDFISFEEANQRITFRPKRNVTVLARGLINREQWCAKAKSSSFQSSVCEIARKGEQLLDCTNQWH